MPYRSFVSNEVLYASLVQSYLQDQVVVQCTSGTRPSAPPTGMVITESDTGQIKTYNGSSWINLADVTGWTSFTPSLTASTSNPSYGTSPTRAGRYTRIGSLIIGQSQIQFGTGMGTGSGTYRFGLPVTTSVGQAGMPCGFAQLFDSSANAIANVTCVMNSGGTYMEMWYPASWPSGALTTVTNTTPWLWASSDYLWVNFMYEVQ